MNERSILRALHEGALTPAQERLLRKVGQGRSGTYVTTIPREMRMAVSLEDIGMVGTKRRDTSSSVVVGREFGRSWETSFRRSSELTVTLTGKGREYLKVSGSQSQTPEKSS